MNMWKSLALAAGIVLASTGAYSAPYSPNDAVKAPITVTKSEGSYQEARTYVRSHYRRTKSGKTRVRSHYRRR